MDGFSILVISDSHGNLEPLKAALQWAAGRNSGGDADFKAAFFLGDGLADLDAASAGAGFTLPWYAVRGNSDAGFFPGAAPQHTLVAEIAGRAFFLSHGNIQRVETGFDALAQAARDAGAEAALFGHTHVPFCGSGGGVSGGAGVFLLNPGSIGRPRTRAGQTFAVLEVPPSGPLSAEFWGVSGGNSGGRALAVKKLEIRRFFG